MTDPNIPVTEDELHAYVDNELPAERRGDVEAWLATHPDDAARVQSWRAMAETLHARYDRVLDEAVPKRLELERLVRQPRRWVYGAVAATLAAFIAGGGVGWVARGASATPSTFQSFTLDALDAHRLYVVEVRHPVEVPGSDWRADYEVDDVMRDAPVTATWRRLMLPVRHVFTHFPLELCVQVAKVASGTAAPTALWTCSAVICRRSSAPCSVALCARRRCVKSSKNRPLA